ncbi:MAG: nucleotidyl transferase AbiEii/AbiGii toxin family protein [Aureispira sp.]
MKTQSIIQKLKNHSRKKQKIHQNTLTKYFQERFLYRLSQSTYKENFLLKGGALAYTISGEDSRHTRDIDFLINKLKDEQKNMRNIFAEICKITVDDGVLFNTQDIKIDEIPKEGNYSGIRIRIEATLGKITQQLQIDIGVGDHVTPGPQEIKYPTILDELPAPILDAYSTESLISEKFNAMIDLGEFNSRLKDFYDIYILVERCDKSVLKKAIKNTFKTRKTTIIKDHCVFQEQFYRNKNRITQWYIFLKKNQLGKLDFDDVHKKILDHLKPIYDAL